MAELTLFSFSPRNTKIHQLDVRFKLVFVALLSLVSLSAERYELALMSLILAECLIRLCVSFLKLFKELRPFTLLMLFVLLARMLSTPGTPFYEIGPLVFTHEGFDDGLLICWRMINTALLGLCLIRSTRPPEVRAAVVYFLRPLPYVPEHRIGTMISLLLRFVPLILNQTYETADAQNARCAQIQKNPVRRLMRYTIPLLRRIFLDAENLVVAMEARCYSEEHTLPRFCSRRRDWIALLLVGGLCWVVVM